MAAMSSDRHYRPDPGYAETHSAVELLQRHIAEQGRLLEEDRLTLIWRSERILKLEVENARLRAQLDLERTTREQAAIFATRHYKALEAERDALRAQLAETWQPVKNYRGAFDWRTGGADYGETIETDDGALLEITDESDNHWTSINLASADNDKCGPVRLCRRAKSQEAHHDSV